MMIPGYEHLIGIWRLLQTVLSGPVISAALAIVVGRFIWNWRTKPVLEFDGTSTSPGFDYDRSEWDNPPLHYRIYLKNVGLSSAKNCKPEISASGQTDDERYEINTPVCWSEGDYPARQSINRGERISFDVFIQVRADGENFLQFPSERGWPEYSTLRTDTLQGNTGGERRITSTTDLRSVDWERLKVTVTAENADAVEAEIDLNWDLGGTNREDVSLNVAQTRSSLLLHWRSLFPV
jgi:hypothetical protein